MNFDQQLDRTGTKCEKYDNRELIFGREDVIPMWVADMDFAAPEVVIEAFRKRLEHGVLGYTMLDSSCRQAICNWISQQHDWNVSPDWISLTPGVVPGVNLAIQAFSEPGDEVIVQPPVYYPFFAAVKNNNRKLIYNQLKIKHGRLEIDFEELERQAQKARLLLLCSPHNPGGSVWTMQELERIAEICIKNDLIILSDEIHADIVFNPARHIPTASISSETASRTITFMSASKTFNIAGLSTAYAITSDPDMQKRFKGELAKTQVGYCNLFGILGLEAAYRDGHPWLEKVMDYLKTNIDFAIDYINQNIPEIKVLRPQATYLLWLDCRQLGLSQSDLVSLFVDKAGVGLSNGEIFGPGGEGFMRMNLACPKSTLEKALQQIKLAFD
ncbi:PatB family C-S lyase [Lentisphaerota bacterium ZTH]|nr:PatB family C-S lyase [Lentisphaerota bacterium]WET06691.1 PatB family C-S lyase [Lentisphaerota bacterium ZTH]